MTSPSSQYAYIELFGHACLGACAVREVEKYGVKMCEARPLDKDGNPGEAQRFPGSAIYRERDLSEEEAKRIARGPVLLLSSSPPPCGVCGYGVCECGAPPAETKTPVDDGTPLCDPVPDGDPDDIPF